MKIQTALRCRFHFYKKNFQCLFCYALHCYGTYGSSKTLPHLPAEKEREAAKVEVYPLLFPFLLVPLLPTSTCQRQMECFLGRRGGKGMELLHTRSRRGLSSSQKCGAKVEGGRAINAREKGAPPTVG